MQFSPTAHNSNWVLCRPNNKRKFFRLDPIMISTYLQIDILAEISSLGRKNGPLSQSLPSALIRHKKRYYSATIRIKNKIWNISVLKSSSTVLFNLALALFVKMSSSWDYCKTVSFFRQIMRAGATSRPDRVSGLGERSRQTGQSAREREKQNIHQHHICMQCTLTY